MSLTSMRRKFQRVGKTGQVVGPIKYVYWLFILIFGLGSFSFFGSYLQGRQAQADDSVVATVNGDDISRDSYERALQISQQRMQMTNPNGQVTPEQEIQTRAGAFEMVLTDKLRSQIAQQQGITVSDKDAEAEQQKFIDMNLAGKLNGATPDEKQQFEDRVRNAYPLDMVKDELAGQDLYKKVQSETKPTDAELMQSFQEYKTRHILIDTKTRSDAEAQRLANDLENKIKAGVSFEDLAKKYSDDPGSKMKGGDLGWVSQKSGFVPEFMAALPKLARGQVSAPVKSQFGYHIIKVDDIRSTVPKDFNKPGKKAQYLKQYTDQLVGQKFQQMMGQARQNAKIVPVDPFVKGYLTEADMLDAQQKGNMALANAKRTEAIAAYEKAAVGREGGPVIYSKLAELYQQSGQDQKAIGAMQQAMAGQTSPDMAFQLGALLKKNHQDAAALVAFQKCSEVAGQMPWYRPQLVQQFRELKRPDLASKEQALWAKWEEESKKHPMTATLPTGAQVETTHTQAPVSAKELKELQKSGKTVSVKTEPEAK
jgi:parvulin-like peptidyl-prolyl isomerase